MKNLFAMIDLVEAGKVPVKALRRVYATTIEVHIARFNGWSWIVANPHDFGTIKNAEDEIERLCKENPDYINEKTIK